MTFSLIERVFRKKKTFPSDDLERFVQEQNRSGSYAAALSEVINGQKESHWIWYIFPQMRGLGHSSFSIYFGLRGLDDAKSSVLYKCKKYIPEGFRTANMSDDETFFTLLEEADWERIVQIKKYQPNSITIQ